MKRFSAAMAAILLLQTALIGCSDAPPTDSPPPLQAQTAEPPSSAAPPEPPAGQKPAVPEGIKPADAGSAKEELAKSEPLKPAAPTETAKPPATPVVTGEVYSPGQAAATKPSGDRTPVSWYYMKQKKGQVPNFPGETKKMTPSQKAVWVGTGKKVYLTFDNGGPMGDIDKMLKVLKDNDVQASYFIAGYNMKKYPDFIRRLVEDGHFVANHSMSHKDFTEMTDEQVKKEINDFAALYKEITGQEMAPVFRFPYGRYSFHLLNVVASMGYTSVFWSTAMKDWEPRKNGWVDAYNDIMNNLHDGNVILLHQASQENMDALDEVIKAIRKEGYEFGTVDELIPSS